MDTDMDTDMNTDKNIGNFQKFLQLLNYVHLDIVIMRYWVITMLSYYTCENLFFLFT
jgi:hypothetical protein